MNFIWFLCFYIENEIFGWKNMRTTGLLFASVNLVYLTMFLTNTSFAAVLAKILLMTLIAAIGVCYFIEKPEKMYNYIWYLKYNKHLLFIFITVYSDANEEYEYFSKDVLEKVFKKTYNCMICVEDAFQRVYRLEDPCFSVKVCASLYFGITLFSSVCTCLITWLFINSLFLIPLIYKLQKEKIDDLTSTLKHIVCENLKKLEAMIPRYKEKN